jgi:aspartate oxidase
MSSYVGPIRTPKGLRLAAEELKTLADQVADAQLTLPYEFKVYNMLEVSQKVVEAAIARKESVGAHYLVDDE